MRFTYQIQLNVAIKEAFDWLVDPQKQQQWKTGLKETKWLELYNPENPVGIRFTQTYRNGKTEWELDGEVVEYYQPHVYGLRLNNGPLIEETIYRLEPLTTQSCRLHLNCAVHSRTVIAKPKEFLTFLPTRTNHIKQLRCLKQRLET
ncbi:SRPBCC family protein [Laceyella putida]|uniref:SRPBCC family protein n=1 Tax=Laceyella putida TaxID=110101 RepID=A0ABW2RGG9_9BACL